MMPGRFGQALLALCLAVLAILAPVGEARAEPTFPQLTGRVVDAANVIPPDEEARLTQKLAALEVQSRRQLVVVTLADLQGYDIADYGYQLGRAWGIGEKDKNTGALLIVAPNERKVRIEVGYGLEPVLTDALSSQIIAQDIVPRFKADDYPGGIAAGVDRIVTILQLPPDEAQKVAAAAAAQATTAGEGDGGIPFSTILWLGFIFLFFILPMLRGRRGGRRYRGGGLGPIIMWDALNHASRSVGGWSGGGFGGGGFSGGGGSFGGGGASGSW